MSARKSPRLRRGTAALTTFLSLGPSPGGAGGFQCPSRTLPSSPPRCTRAPRTGKLTHLVSAHRGAVFLFHWTALYDRRPRLNGVATSIFLAALGRESRHPERSRRAEHRRPSRWR